MGISNKILNTVARLILKIIPDGEPIKTQVKIEQPSINNDGHTAETEHIAVAKQNKSLTKSQDLHKIECNDEQHNEQSDDIIIQPTPEKNAKPINGLPARKTKQNQSSQPEPEQISEASVHAHESEIVSPSAIHKKPKRVKASPKSSLKPLGETEPINVLALRKKIETSLKQSGISCIGDLDALSPDGIKEILNHNEGDFKELIESLERKGCWIQHLHEKQTSKSVSPNKDNSEDTDLVRVINSKPEPAENRYQIPSEIIQLPSYKWIPQGQSIQVAETTINSGLIYFGTSLQTLSGANDPCLIDPSKDVAESAFDGSITQGSFDFNQNLMGYWPSYGEVTAKARRAYLNWLADGKSDPSTDIGVVFLYFYGLERRVIIDSKIFPDAAVEIPTITAELQRLMGIYGKASKSFMRYGLALLDWIAINHTSERMYKALSSPQLFPGEMPLSINLAVGQAAVDKVGVPAEVALQWATLRISSQLKSLLAKYPTAFTRVFKSHYEQILGEGLLIPCNDKQLSCTYHPASLGLRDIHNLTLEMQGIPDVSTLQEARHKVIQIAEQTGLDLDPYSNFIGKSSNPDRIKKAAVFLPFPAWPEKGIKELEAIKALILNGPIAIDAIKLAEKLDLSVTESKAHYTVFCRQLRNHSLFIIPDAEIGAATPQDGDTIVIYNAEPAATDNSRQSKVYHSANLALQLASAVIANDEKLSASENEHLLEQLENWNHLEDNHLVHLKADLCYLNNSLSPFNAVRLNQFKKKIALLDKPTLRAIAAFIAAVTQANRRITAGEIKRLEKIYRALGMDERQMFGDLHGAAINKSSPPHPVGNRDNNGSVGILELDQNRIAELQKETARGTILLTSIFNESDDRDGIREELQTHSTESVDTKNSNSATILGLDAKLSEFAKHLMEREQWSRIELIAVARGFDLMLDGALESLNEASYDRLDMPLSEGDDPVDINPEAIGKLKA